MSRGVWSGRVLLLPPLLLPLCAFILLQVCSGVHGGHQVTRRTPLSAANATHGSAGGRERGQSRQTKAAPENGWHQWAVEPAGRQKRSWILPPIKVNHVIENDHGPFPKVFMMIRSDKESSVNSIVYSLRGPGADQPPVGVFNIDPITGKVNVMFVLDREKISSYALKGFAKDERGNLLEPELDLAISVLDENDNAPEFTQMRFMGNVSEKSRAGSPVLTVEATDADDPQTNHVQVVFSIISQQPPLPSQRMFTIDRSSGIISTGATRFDAEAVKFYTLLIRASDCNGADYGLSSTGTVVIQVQDVNDNAPMFPRQNLICTVLENMVGESVLVLKTEDGDTPHTPAWRARYRIVSGQHSESFDIATNYVTNEGILTVSKALDYESTKQVLLVVVVENEEPLWGVQPGAASTATVTVTVRDQNEPPEFSPDEIEAAVTEEQPPGVTLGAFTATDPDVGQHQQIRYKMGDDPSGWLSINPTTGEVRTRARLDREARGIYNGTYTATILAFDNGVPPQTGTATILLRVTDVNDHQPRVKLPYSHRVCEDLAWQGINVTVLDEDEAPNAGPFTFSLPEEPPEIRNNWKILYQTGEVLVLAPHPDRVQPGHYSVPVLLADKPGLRSEQVVEVTICYCDDKLTCPAALGGIGLGLAALLIIIFCLLILLLLFLAMLCCLWCYPHGCCGYVRSGGALYVVHDQGNFGGVQAYNYEGGGEEDMGMRMNLLAIDAQGKNGSSWAGAENAKGAAYTKSTTLRASSVAESSRAAAAAEAAAAAAEAAAAASHIREVKESITTTSSHTTSSAAHDSAGTQARGGRFAGLAHGAAVGGSDAWAGAGGGGVGVSHVATFTEVGSSSSSSGRGNAMDSRVNGAFGVPAGGATGGTVLETDGRVYHGRISTLGYPRASGYGGQVIGQESVSMGRGFTRREVPPPAAVAGPVWPQHHTLPKLVGMKPTADVRKFVAQALEWADKDPTVPPFDGLLVFCHEGNREDDHSFSPCVSTANLAEQVAQFRPISNPPPGSCGSRGSPISRAATPSAASPSMQLP
ncbi:cadherin-2-like [Lethenteron reissneri]|uniref:cadherin-2-like n=1 Tax=Lethenteron reissneri TaxID=7753 RepID=UPI002AB71009|nr:cadherin-2-like [Lethenteron reissneri]